jgi:hypothetical protein
MTENKITPDKFVIGELEYEKNLAQDLFINKGALNDDFAEHAEKFSWYATAYELCLAHEGRLRAQLDRIAAQLDYIVREEMKGAEVRITEKKVENTVITRPEYVALHNEILEAKLQTGLAKAARDAMIHRKDMLVGLGANYRAEGSSTLSLKHDQIKQQ